MEYFCANLDCKKKLIFKQGVYVVSSKDYCCSSECQKIWLKKNEGTWETDLILKPLLEVKEALEFIRKIRES
jgi:hypothetical protein